LIALYYSLRLRLHWWERRLVLFLHTFAGHSERGSFTTRDNEETCFYIFFASSFNSWLLHTLLVRFGGCTFLDESFIQEYKACFTNLQTYKASDCQ
jgi:hypothetical protein